MNPMVNHHFPVIFLSFSLFKRVPYVKYHFPMLDYHFPIIFLSFSLFKRVPYVKYHFPMLDYHFPIIFLSFSYVRLFYPRSNMGRSPAHCSCRRGTKCLPHMLESIFLLFILGFKWEQQVSDWDIVIIYNFISSHLCLKGSLLSQATKYSRCRHLLNESSQVADA